MQLEVPLKFRLLSLILCLTIQSTHAVAKPGCDAETLRSKRQKAEDLFKNDNTSNAIDTLNGMWNRCRYEFDKNTEVQWLASDYAYYLFKTNQKTQCDELFCKYNSTMSCYNEREKQPWDKEPTKAVKAFEFNVHRCLKTSETRVDAGKLVNEYKIKKSSSLPICQKGPFKYLRFHKIERMDDYRPKEIFYIKISKWAKDAANFSDEDQDYAGRLLWADDINDDGLIDLLLDTRGCGSAGECTYALYTNCGQGKYVSLLPEDQYAYDMKISKESSLVDEKPWKNLEATFRYRSLSLGCEEHIGDFTYPVLFKFDGKKYSISKAEAAKKEKKVKAEINQINKACGRKAEQ